MDMAPEAWPSLQGSGMDWMPEAGMHRRGDAYHHAGEAVPLPRGLAGLVRSQNDRFLSVAAAAARARDGLDASKVNSLF